MCVCLSTQECVMYVCCVCTVRTGIVVASLYPLYQLYRCIPCLLTHLLLRIVRSIFFGHVPWCHGRHSPDHRPWRHHLRNFIQALQGLIWKDLSLMKAPSFSKIIIDASSAHLCQGFLQHVTQMDTPDIHDMHACLNAMFFLFHQKRPIRTCVECR